MQSVSLKRNYSRISCLIYWNGLNTLKRIRDIFQSGQFHIGNHNGWKCRKNRRSPYDAPFHLERHPFIDDSRKRTENGNSNIGHLCHINEDLMEAGIHKARYLFLRLPSKETGATFGKSLRQNGDLNDPFCRKIKRCRHPALPSRYLATLRN